MLFTILVPAYLVLVAAYLVAAAAYFILGERVLRQFRSRYPDLWRQRGEPTFVSFALIGRRWRRPLSAADFFTDGEYRALGDSELTRRADLVRGLQRTTRGAAVAFAVVGFLAVKFS